MRKADTIVFDCDGVLIDVTGSYDATIRQTVQRTLAGLHIDCDLDIDHKVIDAFKATGGFNDEVDLAYAAIVCTIAAYAAGEDPRRFILEACAQADPSGIAAIENYAKKRADVSGAISKLGYPGALNSSQIHDTFNQIFYGAKLYAKLFGKEPAIAGPGAIDSDIVLVTARDIGLLGAASGKKPAIVTGRGRASFDHSIRDPLRSEFDLESSAFLEDEPRSMAKPNPASLVKTIRKKDSELALYVGDSMEDLIMAQKATALGHRTLFCGITATASDPAAKADLLRGAGAHATVPTVAELAKILNRAD